MEMNFTIALNDVENKSDGHVVKRFTRNQERKLASKGTRLIVERRLEERREVGAEARESNREIIYQEKISYCVLCGSIIISEPALSTQDEDGEWRN